ncbi:DUF2177 family protein [Cereibacter sphaeroides]|uniref:DUF2177 family protein n=1 Tax=Rhodobacterales TaxID=204455 RepID=UPI000BBE388B|nr:MULTISPECIES: DUF2177 family protein [Paracoccaceae]MCE6951012.1 DUF2177 family protein [Cereibacter sphaeroides]MCE6960542.1 DUF2177 family protein [Cereibacter sphaeroides]MCE6969492.1 DUF2177 family protein [Cereibacter sphaeroides]MCE6972777.1 DUF2177 family protein [Cereibacter sphaeroides]
MSLAILYIVTALVFLGLDALMLSRVMKPLFQAHIGPLMLDSPRMLPAALFYLGYVAGVVWLVSWPALREGTVLQALAGGAVLGAVAYGTYELTSYTIMRDWHPAMVAVDLTWGAVLTAVSAAVGVAVTRLVVPA